MKRCTSVLRTLIVVLVFAALVALVPANVAGQESGAERPRGYLSGSLLFTTRPAQPPDYHYSSSSMLGGTTPSAAFEGGFFTSPRVSVGGELQVVWPLSGEQVFNHSQHFSWHVSYTEIYALAVFRVHLLHGHLAPLLVVGPAFDRRHFTNGLYYHDTYGDTRPPEPMSDESFSQTNLLIGGGAEAVLPIAHDVSILGSFRLCTVNRDDSVARQNFIGIRNVTIQAGGGLRWTLR